jgi:hypothetical protein
MGVKMCGTDFPNLGFSQGAGTTNRNFLSLSAFITPGHQSSMVDPLCFAIDLLFLKHEVSKIFRWVAPLTTVVCQAAPLLTGFL